MEKLARIEAVEDLLDEMGFRLFRARFDGREMRIEVGVARSSAPLPRRCGRASSPSRSASACPWSPSTSKASGPAS